jgi:hypothetical protein
VSKRLEVVLLLMVIRWCAVVRVVVEVLVVWCDGRGDVVHLLKAGGVRGTMSMMAQKSSRRPLGLVHAATQFMAKATA